MQNNYCTQLTTCRILAHVRVECALYIRHHIHTYFSVTSLLQNHMVYRPELNACANRCTRSSLLPPRAPGYKATETRKSYALLLSPSPLIIIMCSCSWLKKLVIVNRRATVTLASYSFCVCALIYMAIFITYGITLHIFTAMARYT